MNICIFIGKVAEGPFSTNVNGVTKVSVVLETTSKRYSQNHGEVEVKNYPLLEVWDSAADFILKNVSVGTKMWANCTYISGTKGKFRINDFKII